MDWTFGTLLWSTLVFFFWFALIWMFVVVFADLARRDMSGWAKAGWVILIVLLPFLGILIYLVAVPKGGQLYQPGLANPQARVGAGGYPADEIAAAARLHDEGKITAAEFEPTEATRTKPLDAPHHWSRSPSGTSPRPAEERWTPTPRSTTTASSATCRPRPW
jgi:hypothetical protein